MPTIRHSTRILPLVLLAGAALTGCEAVPAPQQVVACAADKLGVSLDRFKIEERSSSLLGGKDYAITYQRPNGKHVTVIYNDRSGSVSESYEDISHGSYQENMEAVAAVRNCGLPGLQPSSGEKPSP